MVPCLLLQSFHLQPTGTPGTYYLQTTSSQGLPLSLANNGTVTLTTGASPSSHEHIILHSLSVSSDGNLSVLSAAVSGPDVSSCLSSLLRRTASVPAMASSSIRSPLTRPPQILSANRSWWWRRTGRVGRINLKPRVSWRVQGVLSRKPKNQ